MACVPAGHPLKTIPMTLHWIHPSSPFCQFLVVPIQYICEKGIRWVSLLPETITDPSEDLLRGDWCAVFCTRHSCNRLFEVGSFFADLLLDFRLGRFD